MSMTDFSVTFGEAVDQPHNIKSTILHFMKLET